MGQKLQRHVSLGHKPENAVYLIMHLFSLQKAKPLLSKVIIFSDSLSVLQSINNSKIDNSVIHDLVLCLHNKWQLVWDTAVDNKLHSIKSILGEWRPAFRTDRKEVVLARLRIGHSFITHSYLLKGEEQPTCVLCDTPFAIKHILLHCIDFQNSRDKYYKVNSFKELFETIEIHNIFSYLKEIGLFNKI